ncbi:type II toxin-antitoxin system RelE/ParE family toxin [Patescibacteria group bacterium]|nr:type II toxin-antitoxin system RelE/ParE family toxin [Patescibacteria group bacterium]
MDIKAVFYVKSGGKAPVEEYLKGLKNKNDLAKVVALIDKLLEEEGKLPAPHAKKVVDKIWELRSHFGGRVFYFSQIGQKIVLLDGITKKTDKIAIHDLRRVKGYYQDYQITLKERGYDSKLYHKN